MTPPALVSSDNKLDAQRARLVLMVFVLALVPRILTLRLGTDVDTASILLRCRSMAEGKLLYQNIYCNKTPLLFLAGQCLRHVGSDHFVGVCRVLMVIFSASCAIPVFLIGSRLYGRREGAAAAVLFALDPHSVFYARQFHSSVAEAALAFWAVWLILVAVGADRRRGLLCLLAGAATGIAFLTKQSAVTLALLFLVLALIRVDKGKWKFGALRGRHDLIPFAMGFAACVSAVILYFAWRGGLRAMWESVIGVNLQLRHAGLAAERVGAPLAKFKGMFLVASRNKWLWILAFFGFCHALWRRDRRIAVPILWLGLQGAFLAIVYYQAFDHYFLPWIAPLCIVAAYGFFVVVDLFRRSIAGDRLSTNTEAVLALVGLVFVGLGMKFAQMGRKDYAAFAGIAASATWLRALMNRRAGAAQARGWVKAAAIVLAGVMIVGALVPYWISRFTYPEPYLSVAAEKEMTDCGDYDGHVRIYEAVSSTQGAESI